MELEHALRATAGGQVFVSPMATNGSTPECSQHSSFNEADLTARQKEVLNLLAAGKSNKQIALALGISEGTVKVHVNAAFRALGVHNRVNATTALLGLSDLANVES
jgi:DNA-binding NarL/FixJ family response regulator